MLNPVCICGTLESALSGHNLDHFAAGTFVVPVSDAERHKVEAPLVRLEALRRRNHRPEIGELSAKSQQIGPTFGSGLQIPHPPCTLWLASPPAYVSQDPTRGASCILCVNGLEAVTCAAQVLRVSLLGYTPRRTANTQIWQAKLAVRRWRAQ